MYNLYAIFFYKYLKVISYGLHYVQNVQLFRMDIVQYRDEP